MRNLYGNESVKIKWQGQIKSIQPRTRVWRYVTDNRTHYHIGYNTFLEGECDEGLKVFDVAISEKQQMKGQFQIGDHISGTAWTKKYPDREFAEYYRAGALKIIERSNSMPESICPWTGCMPEMEVYEYRGARMLSKSLWKGKCFTCYYATMSNVEIQWDFDRDIKKYRFESFCYGPKSCKYYKPGRSRSVPYKGRDSALDSGWIDDMCTENRGWDD
ncbi:MAG: hypothetical protein COA82_09445 [Alkaliphilus sp.]|jgi:hypothetical protein|nr:hypothetical protein [Alkaliphilus transvaalensis]PHS32315.1 MAG: hypothetical protein COA82_09445 [Alkaliphilus sp.]